MLLPQRLELIRGRIGGKRPRFFEAKEKTGVLGDQSHNVRPPESDCTNMNYLHA